MRRVKREGERVRGGEVKREREVKRGRERGGKVS